MAVDADTADTKLEDFEDVDVGAPDVPESVTDNQRPDARDATKRAGVYRDMRWALIAGTLIVATLAGLVGWLGTRAYGSRQEDNQRNVFLEAARQGALNLTTINYTDAEADVQRIIDSSTGNFRDDFEKRSKPFIAFVKQSQSASEGSITELGIESEDHDKAQILVALTVKTSVAGAAEQDPRAWRMRITVQPQDGGAKMSNVEFVP